MSIRGTRWGKKVPGTPSEARTLVLEATGRVVERRGVARTTLADIAAEAGVTRPTVYKHFDSKEAIVEAYLLFIAGPYVIRTLERLSLVKTTSTEPNALIAASVRELVSTMPVEPWFGPLFHGESAVVTTNILLSSEALLGAATQLLEPLLARAGREDLPPRAILDLSIRVVLSYALVPARDPHALEHALELVAAVLSGPAPQAATKAERANAHPKASPEVAPAAEKSRRARTRRTEKAQPAKGMRSRSERTRSRAKGTRGAAG